MTDDLERLRQEHQRLAHQSLGYDPALDRIFAHETRALSMEASFQKLPVDATRRHPLQDPDTGQIYFLVGYDDPATSTLPLPPVP